MKKLITGMAIAALSLSLFAEELDAEWFSASFTNDTEECSIGGEWQNLASQDPETCFTTNESGVAILKLVDVESTNTVDFVADEKKEPGESLPIAIDSKIVFEGCEELPAIPSDAKTALIAMIDGNYWSVGYDAEGETNKWFDSGVAAEFNKSLDVQVKGIYQGESNIVHYTVGEASWDVPVVDAEFQTVSFSGNGSVSLLNGKTTTPAISEAVLSFSTNGVQIVNERLPYTLESEMLPFEINDEALTLLGITEITNTLGAGWSWEVDPNGSVVTCNTNFNYVYTGPAPVDPTQKFLDDIAAAEAGDTVKATGNISLANQLVITKGITLDLDGKTIESSFNGWAIDAQAVIVISNGTITAMDKGIKAHGAAGLKLYSVALSAVNRAVQLHNETDVPGVFIVDEDTTITSSGLDAILCGNGNASSARTVQIDGTITAVQEALTLSGNNTAEINGSLTTTGYGQAFYYGGTWMENKGNAGTQPTLTFNGTVSNTTADGDNFALCTDSGDEVGVNVTFGADAEISCTAGTALIFQVPGTIEIANGEFTASGAAVVSETATAFISGGTFTGTTAVNSALLVAGKKFVVDGNTQTVADLAVVELTITAENAAVEGIKAGEVVEGSNLVFTVEASEGYSLTSVTINGNEQGTTGSYEFTVGDEDVAVVVTTTKDTVYYDVTFTTNGVENVVGTTNVAENTELEDGHIPAIFGTLEGEWDVDPVGAVITCNTNFNFTVTPPAPPVQTWTVTFSTNTLSVAEATTSVDDGEQLEAAQIPEFTGGKWDVDPSTAVITCNTNFNYTIKAYPPEIPEGKKAAYDTWVKDVAGEKVDPNDPDTKEAFLLNCSMANLATAKAAFKIESIENVDGEWIVKVVGGVEDEGTYGNGVVTIENATIPGAASGAEFFQAVLDYEHHDAK